MKKIVVLVSGGGTNLQAIIDAIADGKITNGKIVKVISSKKDVYALERAKSAGIESLVVQRRAFSSSDDFCAELKRVIDDIGADLLVLAGFMCILNEEFCKAYEGRMINVHPALIPSFCGEGFYGLRVHEYALDAGVKVSGATVHFVTAQTDAGPIILQKAVDVLENDTPEALQKRIMEQAEWKILPRAIDLFCNDRIEIKNNKTYIKE